MITSLKRHCWSVDCSDHLTRLPSNYKGIHKMYGLHFGVLISLLGLTMMLYILQILFTKMLIISIFALNLANIYCHF
jgi:hypothetical protein